MDEIIRAVRDCPSGALSYFLGGTEARECDDTVSELRESLAFARSWATRFAPPIGAPDHQSSGDEIHVTPLQRKQLFPQTLELFGKTVDLGLLYPILYLVVRAQTWRHRSQRCALVDPLPQPIEIAAWICTSRSQIQRNRAKHVRALARGLDSPSFGRMFFRSRRCNQIYRCSCLDKHIEGRTVVDA